MDARLQRRVQRYGWDRAAASYEGYWQQQLAPAQERLLALAVLQPGERVIDVAAGTGLVTFRAAALVGPSGSVMATDISEGMVARLAKEAARREAANVTAMRMDAEALDVPEGSFDAALCALGLMYVPDAVAALEAMRRALRPGGRAVVAVWGARNRCGWAEIFPIVDARVQSDVCPMFFQLGTGERLRAALEAAGFGVVSSERLPSVLHYESAEAACGAAFEGGPVALAYSRFDQATREAAHAEYLASIESWRIGRGYDVPGEFVIARGSRLQGA
jgi:ubiquinone/menaquinone biosynthesis C-methylase UbiE